MRTDWPLGPALQAARLRAGISARAAAKRAGISSGRWYQLETGVQKSKGHEIPIGTTATTVAAAARAVDWDVSEALAVAGFDERDYQPGPPLTPLQALSDEELVAEILRRMKGERYAVAGTPQSGASSEAIKAQEASGPSAGQDSQSWAPGWSSSEQDPGVGGDEDGEKGKQLRRR